MSVAEAVVLIAVFQPTFTSEFVLLYSDLCFPHMRRCSYYIVYPVSFFSFSWWKKNPNFRPNPKDIPGFNEAGWKEEIAVQERKSDIHDRIINT